MEYSQEWFKERAWSVLQRAPEGYWDFSDSLLLYSPNGVEEYEEIQQEESEYGRVITAPETAYLKSIAADVIAHLPNEFDFIDLGPGTEHKEQFLFDAASQAGKVFRYIPVDVSEHFLQLSAAFAEQQGIEVLPLQLPFEEVAAALGSAERPRFVSLGLTVGNYFPQVILHMLKEIAGENGFAFIDPQIRERVNMDEVMHVYSPNQNVGFLEKLELLDLNPATDVEGGTYQWDDGIRIWCIINNPNEALRERGMEPGDRILLFQSLRYSVDQLEAELQKANLQYTFFDTGAAFMGTMVEL